ncbi:MAG: ankyrin repeat domain-containing protein [Bacteroidota bacterium]
MRTLNTLIALAYMCLTFGQSKNIFLERDFWKNDPTVREIKKQIRLGNDPTEKNEFAFDGTGYAIIDNAPLESIKYMLTLEGNEVTKPTHGGATYLLWACYKGNLELMQHLLELGADPHMKTSRGTNMLLMAAIGGVENTEIYDLILTKGIPVDYTNDSGANALLLLTSASVDNTTTFDYFLNKGIPLTTTDTEGNNLFNYAAIGGNLEIMKYWASKGVAFNHMNNSGENAILYASQGMKRQTLRPEVFAYLSNELGLSIDQVNWQGQTPLHHAARRGTPELLQLFMDNGVSATQIDEQGNTALLNSASGKKENVALLLKSDIRVNHQNFNGHTALTRAVQRGSKEIFDLLLANGADALVVDAEGNNLLYHAFNSYRKRTKAAADYMIDQLIAQGVAAKANFSEGNTLIHLSIEKESTYLLEKALALGVDVNDKNEIHLSPLHLAAMKAKDKAMLNMLLEHGADRTSLTDFDESPYDLALQNELLDPNTIDLAFLKGK